MKAWCNHQDLPREAVRFTHDELGTLKPEDSPGSFLWTGSSGGMVVRAEAIEAIEDDSDGEESQQR